MCEAKPIIDKFKLKKNLAIKEFNLYQANNIFLCITGIGELPVVSAISFLAGKGIISQFSVIINYGIAGAKELEVGELVEINKITNYSRPGNSSYFPIKVQNFGLIEKELITHHVAVTDCPSNALVDMEGYAVFQTSLKFVSIEQIWIAKVVSDNQQYQVTELNKNSISQLLNKHIGKITEVLEFYQSLSSFLTEINTMPAEFEQITKNVKFSFSEKIKLKKLLLKLRNKGTVLHIEKLISLNNSSKILSNLDLL